tara:strand:+ start:470 stop:727 length:258 start_codon:yes stop_codon:yes gene_type:complete
METGYKSFRVRCDQQIRSVSPPFEEPPKIFSAQFVTLIIIKLCPLAVFMSGQGQTVISDYTVSFVLELKAEINVKISVKSKSLTH